MTFLFRALNRFTRTVDRVAALRDRASYWVHVHKNFDALASERNWLAERVDDVMADLAAHEAALAEVRAELAAEQGARRAVERGNALLIAQREAVQRVADQRQAELDSLRKRLAQEAARPVEVPQGADLQLHTIGNPRRAK